MKHMHYSDVQEEEVEMKGAEGVTIRWLISEKDNAPNFAMRLFEVKPGGHTPYHRHDFEHEVFILEGRGIIKKEDGEDTFREGDFFFVPSMEWHDFRNGSDESLKFICLVPTEK